ncbi:tail fiber protein [Klebsiella sp. RIT-PI-d]|uniref:phage tail protein n=1 Tax=Klebsiella sp. RIT-PI-d TaxID=1681196 RepID=UPI0006764B67|nr:phage tail protein [Klebsiella sp. RIT-PI-d]KNC09996.1 tail fiber protein [Klebsiella sp. RIT-PI-d]
MPTPNPLAPVKGAGTTLWMYTGTGNPYSNPLSDTDWQRLAKIKELTPGEMTAESYDDTYLDDENADWTATAQGAKSAGDTSLTLAWKPGEDGQKSLVAWFSDGSIRAYKIKYPNSAVDVFRGWCSSLGKAIPVKEVITRTAKITNTGKPGLAEESGSSAIVVTGVKLDKATASVAVGATNTVNVSFLPASASDQSFRAATSDGSKATVTVSGKSLIITGVAAGSVDVIVMSNDGNFVATCKLTVTAS